MTGFDDIDCPYCWGTGQITVIEPGGGELECPCPESCVPA